MKLGKVSLVAVMALSTSVYAIEDVKVSGQAALYYQTLDNGTATTLFDQGAARANVGLQLNVTAGLGNGFGVGAQGTYLGTLGLEKNLVSNVMQSSGDTAAANSDMGSVAVTELYLTKSAFGSTLKLGKQELPQALSPFAFSEDWNVFKNTFDAALLINGSLVPNTTLVGAYVSGANRNGVGADLSQFVQPRVNGNAAIEVLGAAYMVTAQNKSIENTTLTASYYALKDVEIAESADALWADIATSVAGINLGVQGGMITPEAAGTEDTTAFGLKANTKVAGIDLSAAYTSVDNGTAAVQNVGGVKTPLYTQMILNQDAIKSNADTMMLKATYDITGVGTLIGAYCNKTSNTGAAADYDELDLALVTNLGGLKTFIGYIQTNSTAIDQDAVRIWTRYSF